jgi:hypothetical protein
MEEDAWPGFATAKKLQIPAHNGAEIYYNMRRTTQGFAFDASFWHRWNVGVQPVRAKTEWRMRPLGASSFRGSYWASYSLT